ncbi:MAG: winged helix-turn-helix transcriptional regulator [Candidatus Lokiarchaeota archaeon]|nr:winged helix-turn-helix transcriptional regulator [Candidatus Lokiarchaeota archaeon]
MSDINKNGIEIRKKEKSLSILGNANRLKILYLLARTEGKLNFNQIAKELEIDKNKLSYHIALLKNNKFIINEVRPDREGRKFSFYNVSRKGVNAINLIEKIDDNIEDDLKKLETL